MSVFYTGVGSRETPVDVLSLMTVVARRLSELNVILRSGGAPGADQAFQLGCNGKAEIFLPWFSFESNFQKAWPVSYKLNGPTMEAKILAQHSLLHPNWYRLSQASQKLHARNCHQVLGLDLKTPSLFVLCYTQDGAEKESECTRETGGTSTAIRLADRRGISCYNMRRPDALGRLKTFLRERGITPSKETRS